MKAAAAKKPKIRVAVIEPDPLRLIGFRALFESEPEFEIVPVPLEKVATEPDLDMVMLGSHGSQNLFDLMAGLKASRPDLRLLVCGSGADDETILKAVAAGAKGYVDSIFIERVTTSPGRIFPAGRVTFTDREKEVLEMLVAGRANKEIGAALGIEERTVKAHVAKLMRKVGVQNRIALSVHAITHSLVTK
jgi:DNA-binding NarL/FixJ family response regulator